VDGMTPPRIDDSTSVVTQDDAELIAVELASLPFSVKRIFTVGRLGDMRTRGNHLAGCEQKLLLLSGRVDLHLRAGDGSVRDYHLSEAGSSVLIHAEDFVTYELLDADSRIIVLASETYEATESKRS